MTPALSLGAWRQLDGSEGGPTLRIPARHLVTHAVVVGMTGSGKTGLVTVLIEEAARARVPTLVVDVKGDLSNLLLSFRDFSAENFAPWVERERDDQRPDELHAKASEAAQNHAAALAECQLGADDLAAFHRDVEIRVLTPGGSAGE